ncbi:TPA: hypothetical protein ACNIBZ_000581 [Acinetobacter baumannii]|uniref:hypothetical protein n=1 Tax=Acinetobacter baumannii TaxID=470 RepID=UPI0022222834|nr:hypothetical protein [Acinetobacter baumannii]MCW1490453.1 hypothetical protein [Acinetobacter baumannii]
MTDLNKEREAFEELPQFKYQLEVCEWNEEQGLYINESGDPDFEYFADACNGGLTAFLTQREEIARLKAELEKAKAQAVPEGYKLVPVELSENIAERLAFERVPKPRPENDPVWVEIAERAYKSNLLAKKWELVREYKILTEASESGAEQ